MNGVWREWRPRSPPGTWRLFGPALLAWLCAAIAVGGDGRGRALALMAVCAGLGGLVVAAIREDLRWIPRHIAIACAVLVLLGTSIDAAQRVRDDPGFEQQARQGGLLEFAATLRGFPQARASIAGEQVWVRADARTDSGPLPVILWFAPDAEPESEPAVEPDSEAEANAAQDAGSASEPASRSNGALGALWGPGTAVRVVGELVPLEPGSSAAYGVRADRVRIVAPRGPLESVEAGVGREAAGLRLRLRDAAAEVPGAELVPGFAVGDTALVDERLEARMLESSLVHLVAVSGANCALLVGAATWCASAIGVGRRWRVPLAAVVLGGFVCVVGPDASVQRAAVMAAVMLLSNFGGKRAVALPALGTAMIALLLADPWQALQPGFALSVAATAGILLLVPALERLIARISGRARRAPRWAVLPIAVALAAQLACGPLLLLLQPGIPAAGVLANVIAGPAAPLGTGLGVLALIALPVLPAVGHVCVVLASLPARWVAATAEVVTALPGARLPWPGGWGGAALLLLAEIALLLAWLVATRRLALSDDDGRGSRAPWRGRIPLSRAARIAVGALCCVCAGLLVGPTVVVPLTQAATTPHDWRVVACDIGQGDAVLLRDPAAPEQTMLVDTGDDPAKLETCLDRFGVRRIALLVLTHDDRDHVGALGAVAERTDAALIAPDNAEDGADRPVRERLEAAGIPYEVGARGATGRGSGLGWEVLAPAPSARPADTNAASLVLRVNAGGLEVLMLADTGADEQGSLLRDGTDLRATIVKVAHHGSKDQDPALPAAANAEYALVSVGADNGYGHPTAETIASFEGVGTPVLRTDLHGSIAVSGGPGALRLWFERDG